MEEQILNFVELSWGEKTKSIYKALDATYGVGNTFVIDIYDTSVVCYLWHEEASESELVRIDYSLNDNGDCTLGEAKKVRITYEEVVEASSNASVDDQNEKDEDIEECECNPKEEKEDCVCNPKEKKKNCESNSEEGNENSEYNLEEGNENCESNLEEETSELQEDFSATPNADQINEEGIDEQNASTFTESENEELEALKRNEKLALINSFASELGEEVLSKYSADVDNYSKDELQISLLKEQIDVMKSSAKKPLKVFKTINENDKPQAKSLDELVRSYL